MWMKSIGLKPNAARALLCCFAAVAICASGCKKKAKPAEDKSGTASIKLPSETAPVNPDTIVRIHWAGKKRVMGDPNSANLMSIWKLPESERVVAQTLDKLAIAPWHPWTTNTTPVTNYSAVVSNIPAAGLLRPLLDDLIQEEWHLEIRKPSNT